MSANANSVAQKYKYNGKELNDELGLEMYDYGARMYDPWTARWNGLDPLADNYYNFSPYTYTVNNPILFVDPDGKRVEWGENLTAEEKEQVGHLIYQLRKNSKSFDKAFSRLHDSDAIYTVNSGDIGGRSGIFMANREPNESTDENGNKILMDDFGNNVENGGKGGEIAFNFEAISERGKDLIDVLPEEFAHAYSHDVYTDGGVFENYGNRPANGNFEFEGQVISGIIKNEAGIRISPSEPTSTAETFGSNFNVNKYSESLKNWFNLSENYYRTGFSKAVINQQQPPTSVLQILKKDGN